MEYSIPAVVIATVLSVGFHLFALRVLWKVDLRWRTAARDLKIATLVLGCILAHLIEISFFTVGIFTTASLDGDTNLALEAYSDRHRLDLWYYSASFYTSLGADRPPSPGLRLFAAFEAVVGLILITWTASFLFLIMQDQWVRTRPASSGK